MDNQIRNDPKQWRNHQMLELIRQQISQLLLQCPELEEDEQLRSDMVEGETNAFEILQILEMKRQNADVLTEAATIQINNLTRRKARFEHREEVIRKLMLGIMQIAHIQKAELPEATLSIRAGTPKVIITDEAAIPEDYIRIKREPNKSQISADLKLGTIISGAELSNAEPVLSIRTT